MGNTKVELIEGYRVNQIKASELYLKNVLFEMEGFDRSIVKSMIADEYEFSNEQKNRLNEQLESRH